MNEKIQKRKRFLNRILLMLFINMIFVNGAYAFDVPMPTMDTIFSGLSGGLATKYALPLFAPETTPFSVIITIFNYATIFIASLIFMYNSVIGTAATAHDGEMLGKKWSSMMMPIRLSVSFAFMLPMGVGGFSVINNIIYNAGVQGSGLADSLWAAYVPTALKGNAYIPPQTNDKIKDILKNAVQSAVCVAHSNKLINKIANGQGIPEFRALYKSTTFGYKSFTKAGDDGQRIVGFNWGLTSQPNSEFPAYTIDACGTTQIVFDTPNFDPKTNTTSLVDLKNLAAAMQNIQIKQMEMLVKEAYEIGYKIENGTYTRDDALADMTRVSEKYSSALKEAAKIQFDKVSITQGVILAQQDGWMGAGSWALKINNTMSSANSIVNNLPRSQFGESEIGNQYINNWDKTIFVLAGQAAATFDEALKKDPTSPKSKTGSNDAYSQQVLNMFVSRNKDMNNTQIDFYSSNPMVVFASIGNNFLDIANVAAATATAASVMSAIPWIGNILTTIAAAFGTAFSLMFWAMVIPGLYLSYYVQMIPFFMFTTAVVMWYILMSEALFASQLWMMMFTTATGDDFIGEQKPGLNLLFSLFMRPALYVIGLIIAMNIQTPIFGFINTEYVSLLANAPNGDHFLWAQLGYGFGYIMIVHTVMMKIWQIPLDMPENIEAWMNVRGSGSVASLKGAAQETMHGTQQLSQAALPAGAAAFTGAKSIIDGARSATAQKQQAELQARLRADNHTSTVNNDESNSGANQSNPRSGGVDISDFNK
ncbi:DotA/TraY family protein [Klebsiella pneumoniae]|uniref:DotA/TraY family protein n=1 Tax=Klebsiella pneumoniae TaxID=573 RepID=UPI00296244A6|nr:DotA/TraY family protein [Klebsiella pneumoniae]MDW1257559.1 DotA/TraY family protein [Klebsiella pneumoniae]